MVFATKEKPRHKRYGLEIGSSKMQLHACKPNHHIFDLCGTLVFDDTTLGCLKWHFKRRNLSSKLLVLTLLSTKLSPLRLTLAICERATGVPYARNLAIKLLRGEKRLEFHHSAREYAAYALKNRAFAPVYQALLNTPSDEVFIASASLDPVVQQFCEQLGVRGLGSTLETHEETFTGALSRDLTGIKSEALMEAFGRDLFAGQLRGYSDNFSDASMLAQCDQAFVVLRRPKDRQRWTLPNATFLEWPTQ